MSGLRVYLAGPEVFLPDARALSDAKRELCAKYGFVGVSPADNEIPVADLPGPEAARRISAANEGMMRECDLLIANLTPFRGPSADVGTAYELGFARALGKPVFGYTNAAGSLLERTRQTPGIQFTARQSGRFEDGFHMLVEDFGCMDNLMLVGAIEGSGTVVVISPTAPECLFTGLVGFTECLRLAADRLSVAR